MLILCHSTFSVYNGFQSSRHGGTKVLQILLIQSSPVVLDTPLQLGKGSDSLPLNFGLQLAEQMLYRVKIRATTWQVDIVDASTIKVAIHTFGYMWGSLVLQEFSGSC